MSILDGRYSPFSKNSRSRPSSSSAGDQHLVSKPPTPAPAPAAEFVSISSNDELSSSSSSAASRPCGRPELGGSIPGPWRPEVLENMRQPLLVRSGAHCTVYRYRWLTFPRTYDSRCLPAEELLSFWGVRVEGGGGTSCTGPLSASPSLCA